MNGQGKAEYMVEKIWGNPRGLYVLNSLKVVAVQRNVNVHANHSLKVNN